MNKYVVSHVAYLASDRTFLNIMQLNKFFLDLLKSHYEKRFGHEFKLGTSSRLFLIDVKDKNFTYTIPTSICKIRFSYFPKNLGMSYGEKRITPFLPDRLSKKSCERHKNLILKDLIQISKIPTCSKWDKKKFFIEESIAPLNGNGHIVVLVIFCLSVLFLKKRKYK